MLRWMLLLNLALLSACTGYAPAYRERLIASIENPIEAEIVEERKFPGKVLCGKYSSYGGNGFIRLTQDFIVTPEETFDYPSAEQLAIYCSDDPVSALFTRLGIGAPDGDWSAQREIRDEFGLLYDAVLDYYDTAYTLPGSLHDLVEGNDSLNADDITDPWGREYLYRGGTAGRSVPKPKLLTLGADGIEGGSGPDADISLRELPYLRHVLSTVDE